MLYKQIALLSARLVLTAGIFLQLGLSGFAEPNLLADLNGFDATPYVDNPWGGVANGVLTVPSGVQLAVDEEGHVTPTLFSPSVAVGDLNGDGLPDLVVADSKGYFWFFPNSGTATVPKFTTGEIMPIWIGDPVSGSDDVTLINTNFDSNDNTVPRIQLIDYSNEKRLSIVAGNYQGKLFYIHNIGSATQPAFSMPQDLANITASTYSEGHLWCNFLAPFLYDFTGNGQLDLVMGEGTYASNSLYRLINKGGNGSPIFNEKFTTKIVPGYGREHLTPQVVDWNNDGKPDIICGERQGFVDLYLNTSTDPTHPTFDTNEPPATPNHVKFGGIEQLGLFTTIAVSDLTGNKLPNLVISNSDCHIAYALNKGKLGAPDFGIPTPVAGVNPLPKVFAAPPGWAIFKSFSMPYVALVSTKLKDDPTFKPPADAPNIRSALKMYTIPHQHTVFNTEVYPAEDTHIGFFNEGIPLQAGTHFDVSFYAKTSGNVTNPRFFFAGREDLGAQGVTMPNGDGARYHFIENTISTSSDWTQVKAEIYIEKADKKKDDLPVLQFFFAYNGNGGALSLTGFNMTKRAGN